MRGPDWCASCWPGPGPLGPGGETIDLDSTICETYGLAKEGADGYTGKRGYHPLLVEGRANTARGVQPGGRVMFALSSVGELPNNISC